MKTRNEQKNNQQAGVRKLKPVKEESNANFWLDISDLPSFKILSDRWYFPYLQTSVTIAWHFKPDVSNLKTQ